MDDFPFVLDDELEQIKEFVQLRQQMPTLQRENYVDIARTILDTLFDQQIAFIEDKSTNKAAHCGRRAGKTHSICAYLCLESLKTSNTLCVYLALTRKSAKILIWHELKEFDLKFSLGMTFNETDLIAYFPNRSRIIISGAETADEIEKLRGPKFKLVAIDEAGSFKPHISALIEEVLEATLMDQQGTMCVIGTPNAACVGYFHTKCTSPLSDFSIHHWTALENPHIPHAKAYLEKKRAEKRWSEDNPIFQREYMGKWVRSEDSIVYRFKPGANEIDILPEGHDYQHILGIDYGFVDATAFVVATFAEDLPNVYLTYCYSRSGMIPSEIAEMTHNLNTHYNFVAIVADPGGGGKMIIEETNWRYHTAIRVAEKTAKVDFIEHMNDDLDTGKLKATPDMEPWKEEVLILQWDEDRKKEQDGYANHLADAALYAWREAQHWVYMKPEPEVEYLSDQWYKIEEKKMIENLQGQTQEQEFWWE